jgi:tRNA A37 threonylcarbamoyladenosine biosynthesis protein TsaE
MEIWKDIAGFGGLYQISSCGNVRNTKRSRPVRLYVNDNGYCIVGLYDKSAGKHKHYRIHRLVAEAFIPNAEQKRTVNHKDGDKQNNAVENLEWSTHKENINHAHKIGLITVTEKQREAASRNIMINRQHAKTEKACKMTNTATGETIDFVSIQAAARFVKGSAGAICLCCKGKRKTYKGCKWGYA